MMRSCLSSQRLKKDVVDSLRPSRRSAMVAGKRKVVQASFGGRPLPLPKPECLGGDEHDVSLYSRRYFEQDDEVVFSRSPLCLPPPPVSSPSSSGKCSPREGVVARKAAAVQEHPSPPAENGAAPPPWSSSSSLSLNDSGSSPPMSPPAVLKTAAPILQSLNDSSFSPPVVLGNTTPFLQLHEDSSSRPVVLDITTPLLRSPSRCPGDDSCAPSLTSSASSSSLRKCSSEIDSAPDIRKELRAFGLDEIERSCSEERGIAILGDVSVITGWIGEEDKRKSVSVVCKHRHSRQEWKDWAAKVNLISRVDDQHICKLQGYCSSDGEQILVYENVCSGSFSDYLFGSLCKALLDWRSRVRIALGAARALAYIHDLAPIEVVYNNFNCSTILLDLDFSVKLAGHGLDVIAWQADKLNKAASTVLRKSEASCKSNIHSFGVFLLELLTGRSMAGEEFLNDERLFTRWAKPYLRDQEHQLGGIIDPHLRRQLPCPGLKKVAALALQCLREDPNSRPSIAEVVDALDTALILQPAAACRTPRDRSMNKCMSLRRFQPPPLRSFSRTFSNKQF